MGQLFHFINKILVVGTRNPAWVQKLSQFKLAYTSYNEAKDPIKKD